MIDAKVRAVERLFHELDENISRFQADTGLKCLAGCGHCCFNPEVEATALEFLPLAYQYYKNGTAEKFYDDLAENTTPVCRLMSPVISSSSGGFCGEYKYRGLICRLFGFSARRNKYDKLEMMTCRLIKENQKEEFARTSVEINRDREIAIVGNYYMKLRMIDPDLGSRPLPINQAIRMALEVILNHYYFKDSTPGSYRKIS